MEPHRIKRSGLEYLIFGDEPLEKIFSNPSEPNSEKYVSKAFRVPNTYHNYVRILDFVIPLRGLRAGLRDGPLVEFTLAASEMIQNVLEREIQSGWKEKSQERIDFIIFYEKGQRIGFVIGNNEKADLDQMVRNYERFVGDNIDGLLTRGRGTGIIATYMDAYRVVTNASKYPKSPFTQAVAIKKIPTPTENYATAS